MLSRPSAHRRLGSGRLASGLTLSFLASCAALLGACGPQVPAKPSWDQDVKPILQAHCYRCHDGGGGPASNANETYKGTPGLPFPDQATAEAHAGDMVKAVRKAPGYAFPMPPWPAQGLEDWQIDTLANWAKSLGK